MTESAAASGHKLWGGRFEGDQNALAAAFNDSLPFDRRLGLVDVQGSRAWAGALLAAGVINPEEHSAIQAGLEAVGAELAAGAFAFQPDDEDIHTAVERRLGELIGAPAGKLHTGRSRNDQVATDFRLWLLQALPALDAHLAGVQQALLGRAESDFGVLLPGYTHLQRAQPLLLSHWWLSHFWPLQRDRQRLADLRARLAWLPLGAGALAGAPLAVDRQALSAALGFDQPAPNSIDAVSARDFAAEFLFCAAQTGVHLSRLAEALVIFSTAEFGFIELADAYSTGSSLMPQKKNPDPLELARGKAGTLIGLLTGLLATLKATPSTYDKDLQEDKVPVFQAADTLALMLPVLAGLLQTLRPNPARMQAALDPAMLATDLADYLVAQGLPFRQAHSLVGQAVRRAAALGVGLDALALQEYQALSPAFGPDLYQVFDFGASVNRRAALGGTAEAAVRQQMDMARQAIDAFRRGVETPG
jgi:argininosuccinate lyase